MAKKNAKQTGKKTAKKPARKTAKKPVKNTAKKSGKAVGSKPAKQAGENKKRYAAAMVTAENLGLHTSGVAGGILPTPRDYSDKNKLQKLYTLAIALQRWAIRLKRYDVAVAALAAGSVDSDSLNRLLVYVREQVAGYAPEFTVPTTERPTNSIAEKKLDIAVFMATQLPNHIDENFNFRWEPTGPDPDDPLDMEWAPPETMPGKSIRGTFTEPDALALSLSTQWVNLPSVIERAAKLAVVAVQKLNERIHSDGKGGFSRHQVEKRIHSLPPTSPIRAIHEEFISVLASLAGLAHRPDASLWVDWVKLTQYLQTISGKWCDTCFGPTVTGKNQQAIRSKRQSKKDCLQRLVATASQYGTLWQGAAVMPRVTAAICGLEVLGDRLAQRIKEVHPAVGQPDAREVRQWVRALDEKAVTDGDREHWIRCLGSRAQAVGQFAEIIGGYELPQAGPWAPKEHFAKLKNAGILSTKKPYDEFTKLRIKMQEAGIAVQGPWEFIAGRKPEPETKKRVADKWLLNPMAQILAPVSD